MGHVASSCWSDIKENICISATRLSKFSVIILDIQLLFRESWNQEGAVGYLLQIHCPFFSCNPISDIYCPPVLRVAVFTQHGCYRDSPIFIGYDAFLVQGA